MYYCKMGGGAISHKYNLLNMYYLKPNPNPLLEQGGQLAYSMCTTDLEVAAVQIRARRIYSPFPG